MAKTTVTVTNNSAQVLSAFEQQVLLGLKAIGETAAGHAKENCPVDTGRLRNSITWATSAASGGGDSDVQGSPDKHDVVIGTNVEYAQTQEYVEMSHTVGRAHFLRDAATTHSDEYQAIMEAALKT